MCDWVLNKEHMVCEKKRRKKEEERKKEGRGRKEIEKKKF